MKLYNQTSNEADKTILKEKLDNLTKDIIFLCERKDLEIVCINKKLQNYN